MHRRSVAVVQIPSLKSYVLNHNVPAMLGAIQSGTKLNKGILIQPEPDCGRFKEKKRKKGEKSININASY